MCPYVLSPDQAHTGQDCGPPAANLQRLIPVCLFTSRLTSGGFYGLPQIFQLRVARSAVTDKPGLPARLYPIYLRNLTLQQHGIVAAVHMECPWRAPDRPVERASAKTNALLVPAMPP